MEVVVDGAGLCLRRWRPLKTHLRLDLGLTWMLAGEVRIGEPRRCVLVSGPVLVLLGQEYAQLVELAAWHRKSVLERASLCMAVVDGVEKTGQQVGFLVEAGTNELFHSFVFEAPVLPMST